LAVCPRASCSLVCVPKVPNRASSAAHRRRSRHTSQACARRHRASEQPVTPSGRGSGRPPTTSRRNTRLQFTRGNGPFPRSRLAHSRWPFARGRGLRGFSGGGAIPPWKWHPSPGPPAGDHGAVGYDALPLPFCCLTPASALPPESCWLSAIARLRGFAGPRLHYHHRPELPRRTARRATSARTRSSCLSNVEGWQFVSPAGSGGAGLTVNSDRGWAATRFQPSIIVVTNTCGSSNFRITARRARRAAG